MKEKDIMRHRCGTYEACTWYLAVGLLSAATVMVAQSAIAAPSGWGVTVEPVLWNGQSRSTWLDELMRHIVTYQTLAEKRVIDGDFQPYLDQMIKVRNFHRAGDRQATREGVNQFMTMLEARVGGVDANSADALWDFCYQVTPDEYHARDRHVRAKGEAEVKKVEEFWRNMEERAAHSY